MACVRPRSGPAPSRPRSRRRPPSDAARSSSLPASTTGSTRASDGEVTIVVDSDDPTAYATVADVGLGDDDESAVLVLRGLEMAGGIMFAQGTVIAERVALISARRQLPHRRAGCDGGRPQQPRRRSGELGTAPRRGVDHLQLGGGRRSGSVRVRPRRSAASPSCRSRTSTSGSCMWADPSPQVTSLGHELRTGRQLRPRRTRATSRRGRRRGVVPVAGVAADRRHPRGDVRLRLDARLRHPGLPPSDRRRRRRGRGLRHRRLGALTRLPPHPKRAPMCGCGREHSCSVRVASRSEHRCVAVGRHIRARFARGSAGQGSPRARTALSTRYER